MDRYDEKIKITLTLTRQTAGEIESAIEKYIAGTNDLEDDRVDEDEILDQLKKTQSRINRAIRNNKAI